MFKVFFDTKIALINKKLTMVDTAENDQKDLRQKADHVFEEFKTNAPDKDNVG